VARVTVPRYADWCFVELVRPDGSIERVVKEHADPSKRRFIEEYDARYPLDPDSPIGSPYVIRTGEPVLMTEMPPEFWQQVAQDAEQLRLMREVGMRSAIVVPLRVRGAVIGDLALTTAESGRTYGEDDLRAAQDLADRVALALDNARLFTELRQASDDLQGILGGVADSVTAQTADGRLVYANQAAAELLGYPSPDALLTAPILELVGRYEMLDEDGTPLDLSLLPGRRALAGEDPEPMTVRYRRAGEREVRWSRIKATPVRQADGSVSAAINVIEDITELKRAEEGQRFLAEASRTLTGSLDYANTLAAVAQLAVPDVADWCAVDLAVEGALDRVAVAHVDPARVAMAQELHQRYPPDPRAGGVYDVLRSGEPQLYADIPEEMLLAAARDDDHLRIMRELEIRSAMVVPMALRDRVLGVISFVSSETGRRFDEQDLALAQDLGLRAASAVENARLYEIAATTAHTLQSSLLPPHLPDVPGLELASAYRPAGEGFEVGGDFYDVFSVAEDQWYAVIGDVCGKGAAAAAVTALARYTLRATAVRRRAPAAILRWLNDAMLRQDDGTGRFCTIACVHLDLSGEAPLVTVACGGHPPPVLRRADGEVLEVGTPGTLLGLFEEPDLVDQGTELAPGDELLLYTDGLTEAAAPERVWSPADLAERFERVGGRGARETVDALMESALGGVRLPRDDVAVLALRAVGGR
jgi:PAS domain S-box-containing protein